MKLEIEVRDCLGRTLGRSDPISDHLAQILRDITNGSIEAGSVLFRCDDPSVPANFVQVWIKAKVEDSTSVRQNT